MFAGDVAREIDRLVVRGHGIAGAHPERATRLAMVRAQPGVLNAVGAVLLRRPIRRDDLRVVMPYTPPPALSLLVDDNVTNGIVAETDGELALTEHGRRCAEAVVAHQEDAVAEHWAAATDAVDSVAAVVAALVDGAGEPPSRPSAFALFRDACDRPTPAARALRLITAVRYWRADAHRAALAAVGLRPAAAHSLNVVWDAHRSVTRVGQGAAEVSSKALAELEARGLVKEGVITDDGLAQREAIEADTDRRTEPLYRDLDDGERARLLGALTALPS